MKKYFICIFFFGSFLFADEKVSFSLGNASQRVNDIQFKFEDERFGVGKLKIDQISSRISNFKIDMEDPRYIDYVKWLTKLSNAEMRGFSFDLNLFEQNVDLNLDIEKILFEIKNIDIAFNQRGNDFQLNSFDFKYILSNLEFFAPFISNQVDEELKVVNRLVPDGKLSKMDINARYSKSDNVLSIGGSLRMLSGSGILNIEIVVNEDSIDLTRIKEFSLKLNNLADGFYEYIDRLEESTNFTVQRLGRGSFEISYSGPIKEFGSKNHSKTSKSSGARTAISNIYNASKIYYQIKGEWPVVIDQLERSGLLDLSNSTKSKWIFDLNLPLKIFATSTSKMEDGPNKTIIFNAKNDNFYGYGSE